MTELPPETVNAANARVNGILNQGVPPSMPQLPICPICSVPPHRTGRNRLSDCGHMRWTVKGWVAKTDPPPKPAAPEGKQKATLHIAFDLTPQEMSEWKPERIQEFFRGVAMALKAESGV